MSISDIAFDTFNYPNKMVCELISTASFVHMSDVITGIVVVMGAFADESRAGPHLIVLQKFVNLCWCTIN